MHNNDKNKLSDTSDRAGKNYLLTIISAGKSPAKEIRRGNILSATDDSRVPELTIQETAKLFRVSPQTVQTVCKSYVEQGFEATIRRKKRKSPPIAPKITGDTEAKIIALCCSEAPTGYCKRAIRLSADKAAELNYIDSINRSSINTVLKKRTEAPSE